MWTQDVEKSRTKKEKKKKKKQEYALPNEKSLTYTLRHWHL